MICSFGISFRVLSLFQKLSILEGTQEREPHQSCPRPSEEREALGRLRWLNPWQCIAVVSSFWCKVNTFTIKKQKKHQTTCYHLQPQETPTPCFRWVSIYLLLIKLSIFLSTYLPIYLILSVCLQYLYLKCIDCDGGWPLYLAFKSQSAQTSTELLAIDLPFLESQRVGSLFGAFRVRSEMLAFFLG